MLTIDGLPECSCLNKYDACTACKAASAARDLEAARLAAEAPAEDPPSPPAGAPEPPAPDPLLVTAKEVSRLIGVSTRTIWRMVEDGRFPRPVKLSRKLVRWNRAAGLAWAERAGG